MPSAEMLLGHIVGDYRLKQILGQGRASVVFLGERITSSQKLVAVKILLPPPTLSIDEVIEYRRRFVREIVILQRRLQHPSILPILASGEVPSTKYPYLVVPYIRGGNLAERLAKNDLPLNKISTYVMQIAEALDYAHSQQVIHRDLKPENVLVDEKDHVYLADFGIAKIFDEAMTQISQPGQMVGTPEYMAPEQALGGPASIAADLYGLGVLAYTLVTRNLPFPPASTGLMLMQVSTMPPIPPLTFRADLPEPAEAVLLRALSKDPADRFATACEFAQALALGIEGQWPQGLHPQPEMSLRAESTVEPPLPVSLPEHVEDNNRFDAQVQSASFLVSPLSELATPSNVDEDTLKGHAVALMGALDMPASLSARKKSSSSPVLVSRRMALTGLVGLSMLGSGASLWYVLNDPFASPGWLKTAILGRAQRMVVSSTPTKPKVPATQQPPMTNTGTTPIVAPSPTSAAPSPTPVVPSPTPVVPTPVPPLDVAITNSPQQVASGTTIPVAVTTNQSGVSVTLHVTYSGLIQVYNSPPQITDAGGQTTFSWPAPTLKPRQVVTATMRATAHDNQGQFVQSAPVQVQVVAR